ncbi:MAG: hypothetical protein HPY71_15815 [Firmicutes bacterium]|nr:hypothetical protein [Bacillota bacterium]
MRENKIKQALRNGEVVIGTMVSEVRTPAIAQMMATAGYQFIFIDMEHSAFNMETVQDMILACRAAGIQSIVRTPGMERCSLSRPLDAGSDGILVPQVETREEVEAIVRETRYYPLGERGCALRRLHSDYRKVDTVEYTGHANEEALVVIQIESERAIEHLDELVNIQGVDAAFIGPNDMSQSYGIPGQIKHPKMVAAYRRLIEVCNKYGVAPGMHLFNLEDVKEWVGAGMRLIAYSSDINMIVDIASKQVADIEQILGR